VPAEKEEEGGGNDDDPRVCWDEGRGLGIDCDSRYRKYKESACLTNLISQHSLDISPTCMWVLLISNKVSNS
jgi:hypothetical protein